MPPPLTSFIPDGTYTALIGDRPYQATALAGAVTVEEVADRPADLILDPPPDGRHPVPWNDWQIHRDGRRTALLPIPVLRDLEGLPLLPVEHPATVVQVTVVVEGIELTPLALELSDGRLARWTLEAVEEADLIGRLSLSTLLRWLSGDEELVDVIPQTDDEYVIGRVGDMLLAAGLLETTTCRRTRQAHDRDLALTALAGHLLTTPSLLDPTCVT